MERTGLGSYTTKIKVEGLDTTDWSNIEKASGVLRHPNNNKTDVEVAKSSFPYLLAKLEITEEGEYALGLRITFSDGDWITSIEAPRFRATDGF